MAELRILPPAANFLKKLKDKKLKKLYQEAIDEILENPQIGKEKTGDLKGVRGYDICSLQSFVLNEPVNPFGSGIGVLVHL